MNGRQSKQVATDWAQRIFGYEAKVRREAWAAGVNFTVLVKGLKVFGSTTEITDERALEAFKTQIVRHAAYRR
jgi:hypothetical protein